MGQLENIELEAMIKDVAKKLNIAPYPIDEIKRKVNGYYDSNFTYVTSGWKIWYDNYIEACIVWSLNDIRKENPIENQMYLKLERCKKTGELTETEIAENDRISEIIEMLSTAEIFPQQNFEICSLHKALKWLTLEQCKSVSDCILVLKDYCDTIGVRSILESADINGIKTKALLKDPVESDLSDNEKIYQPATFVRRLELMTKYIKDTANEKFSKTETLGTRYWLRSTGSDPHCEGRHALFLVNKSTNEIDYVYKPHDLSADNAVVGEDGMLAVVNELLSTDKTFATVHIEMGNHLENYVEKLSVMSKEKAESYFYKAGMLQVITDAMSVTDLHQDNIMPTKDGPLIIDAEVDFFRANFSGLLSALTWPDSDKYPRTASFAIDEGHGNVVKSYDAFQKTSPKDQNGELTYRAMYRNGQVFMLGVLKQNKDYLLEEFDRQLRRVNKSRILPMSTQVFSDHLQNSMSLKEVPHYEYNRTIKLEYINYNNSNKSELASGIINKIKEKFADPAEDYIFTGKAGVFFRENEFMKSVMETFENGTIIAMYIDMNGNIYLDDKPVGYLCDLEDESDKSTEPPRQLSRDQVIGMIKENFVNKFENYDILNGG